MSFQTVATSNIIFPEFHREQVAKKRWMSLFYMKRKKQNSVIFSSRCFFILFSIRRESILLKIKERKINKCLKKQIFPFLLENRRKFWLNAVTIRSVCVCVEMKSVCWICLFSISTPWDFSFYYIIYFWFVVVFLIRNWAWKSIHKTETETKMIGSNTF